MSQQVFVVTDPRDYDGDPFEVAARACHQAEAVAEILERCLEGANLMARNAEMERNLLDSDDPKADEWETSLQGTRYTLMTEQATSIKKTLTVLAKAAGFNPRKAR